MRNETVLGIDLQYDYEHLIKAVEAKRSSGANLSVTEEVLLAHKLVKLTERGIAFWAVVNGIKSLFEAVGDYLSGFGVYNDTLLAIGVRGCIVGVWKDLNEAGQEEVSYAYVRKSPANEIFEYQNNLQDVILSRSQIIEDKVLMSIADIFGDYIEGEKITRKFKKDKYKYYIGPISGNIYKLTSKGLSSRVYGCCKDNIGCNAGYKAMTWRGCYVDDATQCNGIRARSIFIHRIVYATVHGLNINDFSKQNVVVDHIDGHPLGFEGIAGNRVTNLQLVSNQTNVRLGKLRTAIAPNIEANIQAALEAGEAAEFWQDLAKTYGVFLTPDTLEGVVDGDIFKDRFEGKDPSSIILPDALADIITLYKNEKMGITSAK